MYIGDSACSLARTQWHRFDADSYLDPMLQTIPHPAFKVSDLSAALGSHTVLLEPYKPIEGFGLQFSKTAACRLS